ncbi:Dabb family protein [Streptomyces sp. NBC_00151]|uniref:Dabb family protein n=1 Tax=Streptomyces sp. NBC_00151 TaxID=2975669 RepID=UPI002DDC8CE5|nr:Dabb family protein [Streptomyces sp. NBC_00151]WRZ36705.1 Dabb family protein [Streptomyces sp. NBC_00151]WRZ44871.1 Dabb family protein [Streptomyces sp. NBC_00151]
MIRHIVLFKFKSGCDWSDPRALAAEESSRQVGTEVPGLRSWVTGRNLSDRDIAYDFAAVGVVEDQAALDRYLDHPFHQESARRWREISDWVIADIHEPA